MNLLVHVLIRVLETMFVVGAIGSLLVLILTTIEDVRELFGADEKMSSH